MALLRQTLVKLSRLIYLARLIGLSVLIGSIEAIGPIRLGYLFHVFDFLHTQNCKRDRQSAGISVMSQNYQWRVINSLQSAISQENFRKQR